LKGGISASDPFIGKYAANVGDPMHGSRSFIALLVDQNCLLPAAGCLVGTMNAACPAAGPFLSLQKFLTGSLDTALARCWLLRVIDPADELIPTKRRQTLP
jgi:hypothetical protein